MQEECHICNANCQCRSPEAALETVPLSWREHIALLCPPLCEPRMLLGGRTSTVLDYWCVPVCLTSMTQLG